MQASSAQELGPRATAHLLSFPNQKIEIEFNGSVAGVVCLAVF
jgi:hypothetical protein